MHSPLLKDVLTLIPTFWRGIMWPLYEGKDKHDENIVGNIGLFVFAGLAFAFCQNVTKDWELALDVTTALIIFVVVPSFIIVWLPVTLICRKLGVEDGYIGSSVSQVVIVFSISLLIASILFADKGITRGLFPFLLNDSGQSTPQASIFTSDCKSATGHGCDINFLQLLITSLTHGVLGVFAFFAFFRPLMRWVGGQSIEDNFSKYWAFRSHSKVYFLAWIITLTTLVSLLMGYFHFSSSDNPFQSAKATAPVVTVCLKKDCE